MEIHVGLTSKRRTPRLGSWDAKKIGKLDLICVIIVFVIVSGEKRMQFKFVRPALIKCLLSATDCVRY